MFVIKEKLEPYYFQAQGKIIVFENPQDATFFAENFYTYAQQRMLQENPLGMGKVMLSMNNTEIIPVDFDMNVVETINYYDIM